MYNYNAHGSEMSGRDTAYIYMAMCMTYETVIRTSNNLYRKHHIMSMHINPL